MPNHRTLFQDHHGIEQQTLKNSELLARLQRAGKFNIHAEENRLFLPADPQFAQELGVTPHSGGPLRAYQDGVLEYLDEIRSTRDGRAVLRGDVGAMDRVIPRIELLRDTIKAGLINGDLNTNTSVGETPALTSQRVRYFFDNIVTYQQAHAQQIEALKGFTGIDHGWGAVASSESRIVTTLNQIHVDSRPPTRGGNIELQRSGLSLAIANAHHDGRIVLSTQGIHTVEKVLGEEAAYRIRTPRGQQGAASIDLLMGEASARTLVRSGGLLATGADAVLTARRSAELLEQGNATAAQSELNHSIARNVGGWAGGASTAMALGGSGFVPAAVVAADALLLSKAFDKGADLLDNRAIYHQTDKAGVAWQFNGRNWERQAAIDRTADGRSNPVEQGIAASYEKSQELGAMASAKAVELALAKTPTPQDPFRIPAQPSDQRGLDNADWHRNPDTQAWERQVKTGLSGANDRGIYETQIATPERAQQLNQQSLRRIESNIATGQEAMAATYLAGHAAQRAQQYGVAIPAAVESVKATQDVVLGSDGNRYQRNEAGHWQGAEGQVSGNLAAELELTNQMRQPSLEQWQDELAAIQSRPAPSPAQVEQNELVHRYRSAGVDLYVNPETQQAIELAVQRTREASGITGPSLQQLQRNESGQYGYDSPIAHYQTGQDGVARQVAVTGSDELRQALGEVRARQAVQAPVPDSPELRIAALSPDEREAYQQALREANRQGVSTQEAQQVASFAAVSVHTPLQDEVDAPQAAVDVERQRDAVPAAALPPHTIQPAAAAAMAAAPASAPPAEPERLQQAPPRVQREELRAEPDARAGAKASEETSQREAHSAQQAQTRAPTTTEHHAAQVQAPGSPQQPAQEREASVQQRPPLAPESGAAASIIATTAQQVPSLQQRPTEIAAAESASHPLPSASAQQPPHTPIQPEIEAAQQPVHSASTTQAATAVADEAQTPRPSPAPLQPEHPDHALYQQVRAGVAALDARHGREFDETSERMTASLLVLAKDSGLERVDHVLLSQATPESHAGKNLFVVQGEPDNPAHLRASIPTEQAAQTPVEQSVQQLEVVSQRQEQEALKQQQEQVQLDQVQQQDAQARSMGMR
ncbi:XVIPCD domain-containing protein [Stenotrophomonas lacuserhaii]|uniref:XVIPCD domain-containing protein n=1 Tax=Stenotrophomonas lacuserhaii TaxID=2760084 RepID=UPI0015F9EC68|nr:XVIPCD domain-containing protein [Stenotrophomonas lacuserhaii]